MRFWEEVQKVPREGLTLSKRERVLRALAKEEIDKRPFTFWHPFGLGHMKGESLTAAALTFAATYNVDLLRLPTVRDFPLPEQTSLDRPLDLTAFDPLDGRAGFWRDRIESIKSTVSLAEKKIAVFECVSDPLTTLSYSVAPEVMTATERSHPNFLEKALGSVTASLQNYLTHILGEAKIDGIVVEVGSANYETREQDSFDSVVKPHLKKLLNHIRAQSEVPIWIQVSGKRVYLDPFLDLPHDLLSWSHLAQGPALDKLPRGYRGRLAGGMNEQTLPHMSYQDIRRHVDEARNLWVALLCPGDVLPADTATSRLVGLGNFLSKRDRMPDSLNADSKNVREPAPIIDEP